MAHIVCEMRTDPGKLTLRWSEGPASFEAYTLEGQFLEMFDEAVRGARKKLIELVKQCRDSQEANESPEYNCSELARAGFELYQALLPTTRREIEEIRSWLEKLRDDNSVESLEIVVD